MKRRRQLNRHLRKNSEDSKFDDILLKAIDSALSSLGENVRNMLYIQLSQKFLIPKHDIPNRIEDFSEILEKIFGVGARKLEILIMAKLHEKIKGSYEWHGPYWLIPSLTFSQYVELLRLTFENNGKIAEIEVIADAGTQKQEQQI